MGLITNGHRNAFSPFKWMNGNLLTIQNGAGVLRTGYLPGKLHNWQLHGERQAGLPNGNLHPYSWLLPRVAGNMSTRQEGDGGLTADLVPTLNGSVNLTGAGGLTAEAALVISMFCDLVGSGSLTANINGLLNMSADLEGSGDLTAALSGIASMLVNLEGSGDIDATIAAYGNMEIDIVVTGTGLNVANVGPAVWNTIAASYNSAGTMGEKLNDAAAGGGGGGGGTIIREDELAQGGTRFTITLNSAASSQNYLYLGAKIVIISGTGEGQVRTISNYEGAIREATVHYAFTIAPDNTSVYRIIP